MNKRLVLKLIKDIIKQYACVEDFKREKNTGKPYFIIKLLGSDNNDSN